MRKPLTVLSALAIMLTACSADPTLSPRRALEEVARADGWILRPVPTDRFSLISALGPSPGSRQSLAVYLEGEGASAAPPPGTTVDPGPDNPYALRLAIRHPGAAAYLAQPCQFTRDEASPACTPALWGARRFSADVIEAMSAALDRLKAEAGAERLILAGHSGGGALAVLIAARRADVAGIVTVAANLDTRAWTVMEGRPPLTGSLNPADAAGRVSAIPQVHFIGGRDDQILNTVTRSYFERLAPGHAAQLVEIAAFKHDCCWVRDWSLLAARQELDAIPGWRGN